MSESSLKALKKKAYNATYHAANRESIREQQKAYNAANQDKRKAWLAANRESIREQQKAYNATYHAANPDKQKANHLKRDFGISLETYNTMLASQNNACKACNLPSSNFKKRLAVDHCHKTGKVRSLLCGNCNLALGNARDSIDILKAMVVYLESYEKV